MKFSLKNLLIISTLIAIIGCVNKSKKEAEEVIKEMQMNKEKDATAAEILGNPDYLAMSYGGYRYLDHSIEPTNDELKEDMKLLSAMGVKILRTYKVHLPQASNVLKAITELKEEDPGFEMYLMLGVWINCKNAFTDEEPDHNLESEANGPQIEEAVRLANQYPDIVKVIAVGNEAMVKWQALYYVQPAVILKWVTHLQELKKSEKLPKDVWITSSDNFASWGGGEDQYHVEDLNKLIHAVDFISMHTYPMHDTHHNPDFWGVPDNEMELSELEKIDAAMERSMEYAKSQYNSVSGYMKSIGANKPIHIGETGWSSASNGLFSSEGSRSNDEYKGAIYHKDMRAWTNENGISCFYFEAFNEQWKDSANTKGSENHFGLINLESQAKYALWEMVDNGTFEGLTRDGKPITKTFGGDKEALMETVLAPPSIDEIAKNKE